MAGISAGPPTTRYYKLTLFCRDFLFCPELISFFRELMLFSREFILFCRCRQFYFAVAQLLSL
jgi:hypothetical protein